VYWEEIVITPEVTILQKGLIKKVKPPLRMPKQIELNMKEISI
tara:strand:- start:84 stop:212 length:129 start_codon:yes stop_codon:yes gene_type:complete